MPTQVQKNGENFVKTPEASDPRLLFPNAPKTELDPAIFLSNLPSIVENLSQKLNHAKALDFLERLTELFKAIPKFMEAHQRVVLLGHGYGAIDILGNLFLAVKNLSNLLEKSDSEETSDTLKLCRSYCVRTILRTLHYSKDIAKEHNPDLVKFVENYISFSGAFLPGGAIDLTNVRLLKSSQVKSVFSFADKTFLKDLAAVAALSSEALSHLISRYKTDYSYLAFESKGKETIIKFQCFPSDEDVLDVAQKLSDFFYEAKPHPKIFNRVVNKMMESAGFEATKRFVLKVAEFGHEELGNELVRITKGGEELDEMGIIFEYHFSKAERKKFTADLRREVRDKYCQAFLGILPSAFKDGELVSHDELKNAQNNPQDLVLKFAEKHDEKGANDQLAIVISHPDLTKKQKQDLSFAALENGYKLPASVYLRSIEDEQERKDFRDQLRAIDARRKAKMTEGQTRQNIVAGAAAAAITTVAGAFTYVYNKVAKTLEQQKLEAENKREEEEKKQEEEKAKKEKEQKAKEDKEKAELQQLDDDYKKLILASVTEAEDGPEISLKTNQEIKEKLKGRFDFSAAYTPKPMEKEGDIKKLITEQKNHFQLCEEVATKLQSFEQFFNNYKIAIKAISEENLTTLSGNLPMFKDARSVVNTKSSEEKLAKLNSFLATYPYQTRELDLKSNLVTVKKIYETCRDRHIQRQSFGNSGITPPNIELEKSAVYKLFDGQIVDKKDSPKVPSPERLVVAENPNPGKTFAGEAEEEAGAFVAEPHQAKSPKKANPAPQPLAPEKSANEIRQERQTSEAALTNPFFATALYQLRVLNGIEISESPDCDKRQALWCVYRTLGALANCGLGEYNLEKPGEYKIAQLGFGATHKKVILHEAWEAFNASRNHLRHQVYMADNIETGALKAISDNLLAYLPILENLALGRGEVLDITPVNNIEGILRSALHIGYGQDTADIAQEVAQEEIDRLLQELPSSKSLASKLWICNSIAQLLEDTKLDKYIKDADFRLVARSIGHSYANGEFVKQFVVEGEGRGIKNQHERRRYDLDQESLEPVSEADIEKFIDCVKKPENKVRPTGDGKQLRPKNLAERTSDC